MDVPRNSMMAVHLLTLAGKLDEFCLITLGRIHPQLGESFLSVFNRILDVMGVEL